MNNRITMLAIMLVGIISSQTQAMYTTETTYMPGDNEVQDQGEVLIGTWCHSARTPAAIGAKYWQTPSLPWVDKTFLKNFGGTMRSGRPSGGQQFICQHFYARAQKANDGTWEMIDKGNGIFKLKFYDVPAGLGKDQYVFQEQGLGRRAGKVRASEGGTAFVFRAIPKHIHEEYYTMEPAESLTQEIDIEAQ